MGGLIPFLGYLNFPLIFLLSIFLSSVILVFWLPHALFSPAEMTEEGTHDHDSPHDTSQPAEGDGSGGSKPLSNKSTFTLSWDEYTTEKERKETAKRKLMDLMLEMEHVKL